MAVSLALNHGLEIDDTPVSTRGDNLGEQMLLSATNDVKRSAIQILQPNDELEFGNLVILEIKRLNERLDSGDFSGVNISLNLIFKSMVDFLLQDGNENQTNDFIIWLGGLQNKIEGKNNIKKEQKQTLIEYIMKIKAFLNNFLYFQFYFTSSEDKRFERNISDFLSNYGDKIENMIFNIKRPEDFRSNNFMDNENFGKLTYITIGNIHEYLLYEGKFNSSRKALEIIEENPQDSSLYIGIALYLKSMLSIIDKKDITTIGKISQLREILINNTTDSFTKDFIEREVIV